MKILLIGSGGREHALAWGIAKSPKCSTLFCAPGNAGIADVASIVDIPASDHERLVQFATGSAIDFVVIGPEDPLCGGLADCFHARQIPVFGPSQRAAILEGSKAFMKDFCADHNIPTAAYGRFTDIESAKAFIEQNGAPIVVKTDGLAAGKGVLICQSIEDAVKAATDMLSGSAFGAAGNEIIIEEFMDGEELSFFAIADGKTVLPFTSAQDHKRVGDGDTGLNTGGMGAYSPAHMMSDDLQNKIMGRIILPTIAGMRSENREYCGILYAGLMVVHGDPKLIEYNVRFGDPECQVMIPRLNTDLLELLYNAATGDLKRYGGHLDWSDKSALSVVMAANGYPGAYQKGSVIKGLNGASQLPDVQVFHAGTARNDKGDLVSNGGRVLNITASAQTISEAQTKVYEAIQTISWPEGFCRSDIGWRAVEAERKKGIAA